MSMATRCTTCGTIFRVVQDQLKVSEGWVRCGRCDAVFNAVETLFDLEREAPPPWQPGAAAPPTAPVASPHDDIPFDERPTEQDVAELDEEDRIASRFFQPEPEPAGESPAAALSPRDRSELADAQVGSDPVADAGDAAIGSREADQAGGEHQPGFVRAADAQARWETRRARRVLSLSSVALLGVLGLQAAHHFRDTWAAHWPQAQPLLERWCSWSGCRIEAPRRIEDITVENSAIAHAAAGTDSFRLSVTLRNRGSVAVRTPAIDLSLTDTQGQLIARRALNPEEFAGAAKAIAAGAELPLQALISAGNPRVMGYTVEVFYP
jgi:predicted Zn finger-like uncharacterized protein